MVLSNTTTNNTRKAIVSIKTTNFKTNNNLLLFPLRFAQTILEIRNIATAAPNINAKTNIIIFLPFQQSLHMYHTILLHLSPENYMHDIPSTAEQAASFRLSRTSASKRAILTVPPALPGQNPPARMRLIQKFFHSVIWVRRRRAAGRSRCALRPKALADMRSSPD